MGEILHCLLLSLVSCVWHSRSILHPCQAIFLLAILLYTLAMLNPEQLCNNSFQEVFASGALGRY